MDVCDGDGGRGVELSVTLHNSSTMSLFGHFCTVDYVTSVLMVSKRSTFTRQRVCFRSTNNLCLSFTRFRLAWKVLAGCKVSLLLTAPFNQLFEFDGDFSV